MISKVVTPFFQQEVIKCKKGTGNDIKALKDYILYKILDNLSSKEARVGPRD